MKPVVLVFSLLCLPAVAAPTGFVERAPYASGAAVVMPAVGGEYVHAQQPADLRTPTRPVLTSLPQRQAYVFFSAEEEEALLRYRSQQLASMARERPAAVGGRHYLAHARLDWPKVVVRAGEICVPELAHSESPNWRDHLVCHFAEVLR
jgi:hypothetical protein